MRSSFMIVIAALALIVTSAPVLASDAITQCATAQLKTLDKLYKVIINEATKACVAGSAANPQPVDAAKLTAATDKANVAFQKAIDKFGSTNCFVSPPVLAGDAISTSQNLAGRFCLVP